MGQVYKHCDCGHINVFEETEAAPRKCAQCGRGLMTKEIFSMEDYERRQAELEARAAEEEETETEQPEEQGQETETPRLTGRFKLVNAEKGIEILLPEHDTCVLGREGLGQEYFGGTISRKHLFVTPTGSVGIRVEDKDSLNGTLVEGEELPKGRVRVVRAGQKITLDANETGITLELQPAE